jgi:LDH2 family malate/lactate/ureidoglycolate dehydrogenase
MLAHHVRRLADAGLVAVLTATSPPRLGPPGGPKVAGTNPLAIALPGGVVADVSMGAVTWGDVIAGRASADELVPFGGEQWHKGLALAVGLQLLVDALVSEPGHGAVLVVAKPEADPVPALRELGIRLPGV